MSPRTRRARRVWSSFTAAALAAGIVACTERDAQASGYLTARYGSYQGTPAAPNAFAIYFNPAALGGTHGTTLTGDVALAMRWAHYSRREAGLSPSPNNREALLSDQTYIDANTGHANLLDVLALPFVGVNTDFGTKHLRAGYAFYIPFGGAASWQKRNVLPGVPGAQDGVQRWHNISGQILAIYNTFAFAYELGESGFSVGASVSPVIHHVSTVRARTADDSDDIYRPDDKSLKEGRSYLDANGLNLAASAGVYWQSGPDQRLRLGLAYLSQPGFGQTRMSGTLDGRTSAGDVRQDVDFLQSYPDIIRLGATYRLPNDKVELRSDVEFVRWSVFDRQCVVLRGKDCDVQGDGSGSPEVVLNIPRNWNNAIGYRLGAGYQAMRDLEIFGSAGFSTSAVPKETIDASTIDSFTLLGAIGARYVINRKIAVAGSYNHVYLLPVNTDDSNVFDQQKPPSRSPSADGKYYSQIGFFDVNVSYTF